MGSAASTTLSVMKLDERGVPRTGSESIPMSGSVRQLVWSPRRDRLYATTVALHSSYDILRILPTDSVTTRVYSIIPEDGSYEELPAIAAGEGLPEWIEEFHEDAIFDYEDQRDGTEEDEVFTWPDTLADWELDDVDAWWESEEFGIRAVAVSTKDLIVADMKAVDPVPHFQPTHSWTRGVQFVMAGGSMGILAAINDEVERSHVANISLIFFIIFVLHSTTYKSIPSGAIILLQISTATMLSLAYMAVKGMGLNIIKTLAGKEAVELGHIEIQVKILLSE